MHYHHHSGCNHHHLSPSPTEVSKVQPLWVTLLLMASFSITELIVSTFSHSLALLADSGHMLSDSLALGVALLAVWIAKLPASHQATFGYRRVEILAALANGLGLVAIALWITWESISRLQVPPTEILSLPMLITAAAGLGVSSLNALLLHHQSHDDLNLQGAFLHMVADAISSVGVILAALLVWMFHWNWADGAISILVALLILLSAVPLIRQSLNILLEKTPNHLDLEQLYNHLKAFDGVETIERLRVWAIALNQEALSAHLIVNLREGEKRDRLLQAMQASLQQEFGIQETVLQMSAPIPVEPVNLSVPERLELLNLSSAIKPGELGNR
jgi:cobalt-zinc-cadmium efflux system protein